MTTKPPVGASVDLRADADTAELDDVLRVRDEARRASFESTDG